MNRMQSALALLGVVVSVGCGGDGKGVAVVGPPSDMMNPPASTDGGIDAGPVMASSTTGPLVTLMGLTGTNDPVAGPVLTGDSVDIKCEAKERSSAAPIDPTQVNIEVYTPNTMTAAVKVPATLQGADLFGASVPLNALPTGSLRIRCNATDKGTKPLTGWNEYYTFYDGGPVITFTNLNEMSVIARGTDKNIDLAVQFTVVPSPLASADTASGVADVKLSISERDVDLDPPVANAYAKGIDFYDFFNNAPVESVTIAVTATDKRSPSATSTKKLIVKVDGQGPQISVTSPSMPDGQPPIVGGTVTLVMTITDDLAGVAQGADTLFADIAGKTYPLMPGATNSYSFTFEASQFTDSADVTAVIHAADKAGNQSVSSFGMRLDTIPPWVSLDPANVRVVTVSGTTATCSGAFDPLGASPEDGEVIDQKVRFRAFVWERGKEVGGATEIWISGVRDRSVTFYAQQDTTKPLIINQAGTPGGFCDAVSTAAPANPFVYVFQPIQTLGTPVSSGDGTTNDLLSDPAVTGCAPLNNGPAPARCGGSEMSYGFGHTMGGHPSVVFAADPTTPPATGCTGTSYDINMGGGWTCVAASARDNTGAMGNLGVSRPIRVCHKVKATDCDGAAVGAHLDPPASLTCTDGCVLPADWTTQPEDTQILRL